MGPQGEETELTEVTFRDDTPQFQDKHFSFVHHRQGGNSDLYFYNFEANEDMWNIYWADTVPGAHDVLEVSVLCVPHQDLKNRGEKDIDILSTYESIPSQYSLLKTEVSKSQSDG